jgi:hypothetical protein
MTEMTICPSAEELRRYLLGETPEAEGERLAQHLSRCPACVAAAHTLESSDPLLEAVRASAGGGPDPSDVDEGLIDRLCGLARFAGPSAAPDTVNDASGASHDHTPPPPGPSAPAVEATEELLVNLAPPEAPDEIGRLGDFRILKALGAGGMGVVFRAEDTRLKRPVALKVMRPLLAAHPTARERFLREARAAAAVKHDHVAVIYEVGEGRGVPFLAMELLEGESLEDRLKRDGRLPLPEALRVGRETAEALAAAHERGLIHRDVKPANVWQEAPHGRTKVLDFGLARAASGDERLTQSGAVVGTPAYMAPEQARGEAVDARADLFSLGCVLYRAATGEPPFRGADAMSLLLAVTTQRPRPPRERNPAVPPALNALILRLLARDPAGRPASARQVVEALADVESGLAAAPRRAVASRPRRLVPAVVAAVAALALLGILGILYGGTLVRVATNRGELVIQVDDPDVEVGVKQGGATVVDHKKDRQYELTAADGDVEFYEAASGVRLATKHFTLRRGERTVVDARVEVAEAKQGPQPPAPGPAVPPPATPPADREEPFVVVRKGGGREEFKQLSDALAGLRHGDAVEVYGNGPFPLPMMVREKNNGLTLRAAAGYRPRFFPEAPLTRDQTWITVHEADLRIEGCDFQWSSGNFVNGTGPGWELRNCRFMQRGEWASFVFFGGGRLQIDSSLIALEGIGVYPLRIGPKAELDLTNSVLLASCDKPLLYPAMADGQTFRLRHTTVVTPATGSLLMWVRSGSASDLPPNPPKDVAPVTVDAQGNLFQVGPVAVQGQYIKEQLRWSGADNEYAGPNPPLARTDDQRELARGLDAWAQWWGRTEAGSRESPVAFPGAFHGPLDYEPLQWKPPDALDGKRYGADVGRVAARTAAPP